MDMSFKKKANGHELQKESQWILASERKPFEQLRRESHLKSFR
jgi:hypothetical protein